MKDGKIQRSTGWKESANCFRLMESYGSFWGRTRTIKNASQKSFKIWAACLKWKASQCSRRRRAIIAEVFLQIHDQALFRFQKRGDVKGLTTIFGLDASQGDGGVPGLIGLDEFARPLPGISAVDQDKFRCRKCLPGVGPAHLGFRVEKSFQNSCVLADHSLPIRFQVHASSAFNSIFTP